MDRFDLQTQGFLSKTSLENKISTINQYIQIDKENSFIIHFHSYTLWFVSLCESGNELVILMVPPTELRKPEYNLWYEEIISVEVVLLIDSQLNWYDQGNRVDRVNLFCVKTAFYDNNSIKGISISLKSLSLLNNLSWQRFVEF